jgi:hypothetical protein
MQLHASNTETAVRIPFDGSRWYMAWFSTCLPQYQQPLLPRHLEGAKGWNPHAIPTRAFGDLGALTQTYIAATLNALEEDLDKKMRRTRVRQRTLWTATAEQTHI